VSAAALAVAVVVTAALIPLLMNSMEGQAEDGKGEGDRKLEGFRRVERISVKPQQTSFVVDIAKEGEGTLV
jgi:hypothetical protein